MTPPDRARLKARNLELFRRCTVESVYRRLTSLEPKWELVFDEDGNPDLMADGKSVLRPDPADADYPPNFAPGSIIRFTATAPNRDRIDVHTFRFLDATLNRAAEEGITFYDQPTTYDTFYLVIFGIGLGRHIRPLIEQTNGLNVILVEPDIEFLWHSLEVCDWIDLIGGIQERGGEVDFILTEDVHEISGNIWKNMKRTNPCSADGFICCVHHHPHMVEKVIDDLTHDVSLITSELGFFYDETLMMWNTHQNLNQKNTRVFTRAPDKDPGLPAFIVGSGPSLDDALEVIKENEGNAVIISCGSALRPLILNGITPDFQIELENLNVSPMVSQVAEDHDLSSVTILASSTVDTGALSPFGDIIFYFRYSLSPYPLYCGSDVYSLSLGGPTVTNAGLSFAQDSGFRDIYFFGVDAGVRSPEHHHAKDSYHFTPGAIVLEDNQTFKIPVPANFGGTCLTSRGLYSARTNLISAIKTYGKGRRFFNCSDGALLDGATPLRPGELSLPDKASEKPKVVRDLIENFPPLDQTNLNAKWPGAVMAKNINAYVETLKGCLNDIEDFDDKTYVTRLMDQFQPHYGYVDPPPKDSAMAVNFLFRGTLIGMLVFFEYYLARVADRTKVSRFGEIGRQELFNRLEDLKEIALDSLGGPAPKEPPPFDGGTAPEGDVLAAPKRISRNSPCPCGSGRKYKHCHGVK